MNHPGSANTIQKATKTHSIPIRSDRNTCLHAAPSALVRSRWHAANFRSRSWRSASRNMSQLLCVQVWSVAECNIDYLLLPPLHEWTASLQVLQSSQSSLAQATFLRVEGCNSAHKQHQEVTSTFCIFVFFAVLLCFSCLDSRPPNFGKPR